MMMMMMMRAGITTFQLDIKCAGLTTALLRRALTQAKAGRLHILGEMQKALPGGPRASISQFVPSATVMKVDPDQVGKVSEAPRAYCCTTALVLHTCSALELYHTILVLCIMEVPYSSSLCG